MVQDGEGRFFLRELGCFTVKKMSDPFERLVAVTEHFIPSMNCLLEIKALNDPLFCLGEVKFS